MIYCRISRIFALKGLHTKTCRLLSSTPTNVVSPLKDSKKPVALWLFGMSALVAGMVSVGGITRLTRSGLSMTDWKLQGSLPPMNEEEWEKEFSRYKTFPEYQQRKNMTLSQFKYIYFWEYSHRMMGRGLGIAFALPGAYFLSRGMIPKALIPRLVGLFALGGTQGLVGWWMVKSGLGDDVDKTKEIRVNPYRLATHLGLALTTFSILLWTAMDVIMPEQKLKDIASKLSAESLSRCRQLRLPAAMSLGFVAMTAFSGAFVAGNDAGRAYNTFPKMGDNWIPPMDELIEKTPFWRNFFESTALVQLDHRILAGLTISTIAVTTALAARSGFNALPTGIRHGIKGVAAMSVIQVSLGIATLLTYVPLNLAATHQIGSVVLLATVVGLNHSFKFLRHAPNAARLQQIAKSMVKS